MFEVDYEFYYKQKSPQSICETKDELFCVKI